MKCKLSHIALLRGMACRSFRITTIPNARSLEATWRGIGQLLAAFTANECANYFTNAGYASA
jgi:hypothetical protein